MFSKDFDLEHVWVVSC